MVVDVDLEGSGLKRCRLAAFLFCGQALPPLPSLQARKAVARDGFVWCVCVCVRGLCLLFLRMVQWQVGVTVVLAPLPMMQTWKAVP